MLAVDLPISCTGSISLCEHICGSGKPGKYDISTGLMRSETFDALASNFLLSSTRNKGQGFTNGLLLFPPFGANVGKSVIYGISELVL